MISAAGACNIFDGALRLCTQRSEMGAWSVYVVRTGSGALYTGIAMDVDRRVGEHGTQRGAKYLRGRGPLDLVYRSKIGDHGLALRVEHAVKRLSKLKKETLVAMGPSRSRLLRTLELTTSAETRDPFHATVPARCSKQQGRTSSTVR